MAEEHKYNRRDFLGTAAMSVAAAQLSTISLATVKKWVAQYRDKGLTIIGVHTPESDLERNVDDVRREVAALGIT